MKVRGATVPVNCWLDVTRPQGSNARESVLEALEWTSVSRLINPLAGLAAHTPGNDSSGCRNRASDRIVAA